MILDQMVGGIPQVHSASVDFFLGVILICYGYLQIFELCHTFSGFITCVYLRIVILCCMLFMEHKYLQPSQHLLLDQSPYSGLMKLMVCML